MTVSFSDIQGGMGEATIDSRCTLNWDEGNIDSIPLFLNPGMWHDRNTPTEPNDDSFMAGDYHITPVSPCFNAGDSNSIPEQSTTDIDGETRISGGRADMGFDEVLTNLVDFNLDGIVDSSDLLLFADQWLQNDDLMDFNNDGVVNLVDYAYFASAWYWKAEWYLN